MKSQEYKDGYNDALSDVRGEIDDIIEALKKQNPDPLGSMEQCLADAEIEALKLVKDYLRQHRKR